MNMIIASVVIATALFSETPRPVPSEGLVPINSWQVTTDPAGWFQAPGCIIPKADGIYTISARVVFAGSAQGGGQLTLAIQKRSGLRFEQQTKIVGQAVSAPRSREPVHVVLTLKTLVSAGECLSVAVGATGGGTAFPRSFGVSQEVP